MAICSMCLLDNSVFGPRSKCAQCNTSLMEEPMVEGDQATPEAPAPQEPATKP